jgi:hypothetical protein
MPSFGHQAGESERSVDAPKHETPSPGARSNPGFRRRPTGSFAARRVSWRSGNMQNSGGGTGLLQS